ncbi:hypothetical protein OSB04_000641 [Centaurea solstitialis]|uniref:Uncharacterized protein n=1 Tax=Centaurea solstitialis TaxID=347529 RepID=A0AA38TPG4_9ASTR|nr:hypothetical protein OSB04_000641 [Centaurea solstitialis]
MLSSPHQPVWDLTGDLVVKAFVPNNLEVMMQILMTISLVLLINVLSLNINGMRQTLNGVSNLGPILLKNLWGNDGWSAEFIEPMGRSGESAPFGIPFFLSLSNHQGFIFLCIDRDVVAWKLFLWGGQSLSPRNMADQGRPWSNLSTFLASFPEMLWILCDDYNERRFGSELVEPMLGGRKFTWSNSVGTKTSKLDHFLISRNLRSSWVDLYSFSLPMRILSKRLGDSDFNGVIFRSPLYKFCHKLKHVKASATTFNNVADVHGLSDLWRRERDNALVKLKDLETQNLDNLKQQTKVKWVKEGMQILGCGREGFCRGRQNFECLLSLYYEGNDSFIALVPKVKDPQGLNEFRRIYIALLRLFQRSLLND